MNYSQGLASRFVTFVYLFNHKENKERGEFQIKEDSLPSVAHSRPPYSLCDTLVLKIPPVRYHLRCSKSSKQGYPIASTAAGRSVWHKLVSSLFVGEISGRFWHTKNTKKSLTQCFIPRPLIF
jgi:hypothetical protein